MTVTVAVAVAAGLIAAVTVVCAAILARRVRRRTEPSWDIHLHDLVTSATAAASARSPEPVPCAAGDARSHVRILRAG